MTDHELEQRLRSWYRVEIGEAERAPAALRASVAGIPPHRSTLQRRMPWAFPVKASIRFAAAAVIAVLAVGGAFYALEPRVPAAGGPSQTPGLNPSPTTTGRAGTWTSTGSMITPRRGFTATLLRNGKVLVAGGATGDLAMGGSAYSSAELYDPATRTWTATGDMATPRYQHTATLLSDGRVLVAGGDGDGTSAELYDPASGTWTATGNLVLNRYDHTATLLLDGRVLVAGGYDSGSDTSAELYDPASGTWTATGDMRFAKGGDWMPDTATLLPDGRVLLVGGADGHSAQLYDPATGTWTATGSMVTPRSGNTATLLTDGRVLVAGGGGGAGSASCCAPSIHEDLPSAELYDPATGTWTATGDLVTPRTGHTATLLSDGTVLVAGGDAIPPVGSHAELYDPASGTWTATANLFEVPANLVRNPGTATLLPGGTVLFIGSAFDYSDQFVLTGISLVYDPTGRN